MVIAEEEALAECQGKDMGEAGMGVDWMASSWKVRSDRHLVHTQLNAEVYKG